MSRHCRLSWRMWQAMGAVSFALWPAISPPPGQTRAGNPAQAHRPVHETCDDPIELGHLLLRQVVLPTELCTPPLTRFQDTFLQDPVRSPSCQKTLHAVRTCRPATVVDVVVADAAMEPGWRTAVDRLERCDFFGEILPPHREATAAAIGAEWRQATGRALSRGEKPFMSSKLQPDFNIFGKGCRPLFFCGTEDAKNGDEKDNEQNPGDCAGWWLGAEGGQVVLNHRRYVDGDGGLYSATARTLQTGVNTNGERADPTTPQGQLPFV